MEDGMGKRKKLVNDAVLDNVKTIMLGQLEVPDHGLSQSTEAEENKIKGVLDASFQQNVSGSVLLIGPEGSGKRTLTERVLRLYDSPDSSKQIVIARLRGLACTSDRDALTSLARQLGMLTASDNFNISIEALQNHFQQSRLHRFPTVLVVEDLEEFTRGPRQVLLYTLLDLLHRNDFFYVVIGLTHRVDITLLLEKRVHSRLNAQCVFLRPPPPEVLCQMLMTQLLLGESQSAEKEEQEVFREEYNRAVRGLFEGPEPATGGVREVMRRGVAWGRGLSFFLTVARLAVSRLTTSRPLLSDALFQECVEDMEVPSGVLLSLQSLSRVEMFCFIAIVRLHVRMRGGVTAGSGLLSAGRAGAYAVAAGRAGPVSDGRGFNVEKVLCEFERMTGLLKKKVVNKRHVVAAILALAENTELIVLSNGRLFAAPGRTGGGGSSGSLRGGRGAPGSGYPILDTTQVSVNVAMAEVLSIFSGSDISLPDKMRRAVFEPLDSLRTSHFDSVVASSSG